MKTMQITVQCTAVSLRFVDHVQVTQVTIMYTCNTDVDYIFTVLLDTTTIANNSRIRNLKNLKISELTLIVTENLYVCQCQYFCFHKY